MTVSQDETRGSPRGWADARDTAERGVGPGPTDTDGEATGAAGSGGSDPGAVSILTPFRLLLLVLGGAVLALGIGILVRPSLAALVPIGPLLAVLGNEYLLVAAFGVVAILGGLSVLLGRGVGGIDQTTPPEPEEVHPVPRSGESFEDFLAASWLREMLLSDRHQRIRTRLREAAIATVVRQSNCTRQEARERIDSGTWTDESTAANFLATGGTVPSRGGVLAVLRGESPYQRSARLTAEEIARYDGGGES